MSNIEHIKSRQISSMDLRAALVHDRHIADDEGFPRVAQRAADNLQWLDEATTEIHDLVKDDGGWYEVSIVVKGVKP